MFPYRDNFTHLGKIWSVYAICAVMIVLYMAKSLGGNVQFSIDRYFPFYPLGFSEHPLISAYRLISASFVHEGFFHIAGNILFFVVFGRTLESLFGSLTFLWVFPLLGVVGFLVQWALMPNLDAPVLGSSGSIAALMGAYFVLFPKAKIRILVILGIFFKRVTVPAWVFLPYWIGIQLISLLLGSNDGVAYGVHVGSFFAGLIGAMIWKVAYLGAEDKLSEFKERSLA